MTTAETEGTPALVRAGFFDRGFASLIDALLLLLVAQLAAALAYALSGGSIQTASFLSPQTCLQVASPPTGIEAPPFQPTMMLDCRYGFPGLPSARSFIAVGIEQSGTTTLLRQSFTALDESGRRVTPLSLPLLWLPLLLLYKLAFEGGAGTTPGKRLLGMRVLDRAARPAGIGRVATRNLLLIGPVLALATAQVSLDWAIASVTSTASVLLGVLIAGELLLRRDTWYDRIAGTAVLRP
jgi:uncharacterized RDD family membrane protein YckC